MQEDGWVAAAKIIELIDRLDLLDHRNNPHKVIEMETLLVLIEHMALNGWNVNESITSNLDLIGDDYNLKSNSFDYERFKIEMGDEVSIEVLQPIFDRLIQSRFNELNQNSDNLVLKP